MQRLLQHCQALCHIAGRRCRSGRAVPHGCRKAPLQRVHLPRQPQQLLPQLRLRADCPPVPFKAAQSEQVCIAYWQLMRGHGSFHSIDDIVLFLLFSPNVRFLQRVCMHWPAPSRSTLCVISGPSGCCFPMVVNRRLAAAARGRDVAWVASTSVFGCAQEHHWNADGETAALIATYFTAAGGLQAPRQQRLPPLRQLPHRRCRRTQPRTVLLYRRILRNRLSPLASLPSIQQPSCEQTAAESYKGSNMFASVDALGGR